MQRRTFLKSATVVGTTMVITPSIVLSNTKANPFGITKKPRKFTVTNSFDLQTNDEIARLWVPLPLDSSYQKVLKISYDGDFDEAFISNNNEYNTKLLYAKWNKNSKSRKLVVKFDVIMQERTSNLSKATNSTNFPENIKLFLKGTSHTPVNKTLTDFATNLTKNSKTQLEKAQAIYDWTVDNMYRDESVIGCGVGDATRIIEKKLFGGKCTDVSSVFVALLRNAGIPAREIFGVRVGKSKISKSCGKANDEGFAKITGGQHCRAEFYLDGAGWIPADPADVTKVRKQEKLTNNDKKIKDLRKYFFGNWEMNWLAFNYARDFVLNPKPAQYPLNMLGYPYAEMGEDVVNYYNPKEFGYSYTSQEVL
ncbi:transglutaminase family protein [Malaciobacter marinus]|uniref:Transglutaminase n=1 Tax=Malaciobacter marinus TaxID=505249 RepID=A0A347TM98_9BACT|nr:MULTISPECIES: transglutaminase-like domain-containing protein [Malaciobacter]AXX87726.1 transglutaminase family protein [Malaciobacter marinus]PHO15044.1 transglutaminase [Malaciobacter marinus]RYA24975.1 transglutaminase domain-containing protein [Malaciobacter halophilus]